MLYRFAHFLRDKMPWVWDLVDVINSWLFSIRFGKRLKEFKFLTHHEGYQLVPIRDVPTNQLVKFFMRQPEEAYTFFKPHGFDADSIKKLQRNNAFLGYVLIKVSDMSNAGQKKVDNEIVGYCFNRSFFHGKGFRGRIVDYGFRGKGLGTMMNKILNEVGFGIGLRLFETVSKDNIASYRSAISASKFKVLKELPHNELYLEILSDNK